jgi:hypothetical protein
MKNLKIGITIGLNKIDESIWTNGMKLNILTLIKLLQKSTNDYEVYLLNTNPINISSKPEHFNNINVDIFDDKYHEMDLIIIMGSQPKSELIQHFKSIKTTNKVVSYKCGNNFVLAIEEMLFKEGPKTNYIHENYFDEIWYVPQQHETNNGYYSTLYRANSIVVPFIWDKSFLDKSLSEINLLHKVHTENNTGNFRKSSDYQPKKEKTIGVLEPNLNIVKTCIIPSMIAEESYRSEIGKKYISKLSISNSENLKNHKTFLSLLNTFDLYKDGKIRAENRHQTAYYVSQYVDIVICHQLLNPLNYLYLDVAYMGYPVLHNAYMCKDIGYYYNGSDTIEASKILNWILENHDDNLEEYKKRNSQVLYKYYIENPELIKSYDLLIKNLFDNNNKNTELQFDVVNNKYLNL